MNEVSVRLHTEDKGSMTEQDKNGDQCQADIQTFRKKDL